MESIMYRDPELEASFSFSCYDFNSALAVFSDDDDDDDDEYIEIALEQPTNTYGDGGEDHVSAQELEFRISFSSNVPFLGSEFETMTTPSSSSTSSTSTSTSTLSCSSTETGWAAASGTGTGREPARTQNTIKRRVQFRAVNRLLNTFLSTPAASSSEVIKKDGNQRELARSRKATKITKTTNSGIMMKFLIKCRSINIRTILASFLKPYQIVNSLQDNSGQKKMKRSSRENNVIVTCQKSSLVKPFDKWLSQREKTNGEKSRVFDRNLDSFRGILEAMSTSLTGCKETRRKDCSSCTKNSIHQGYPIDQSNSIQAAIAHCKRSFGQTSEFRF